jgi:GNAT superfamily N-acetyltransferase
MRAIVAAFEMPPFMAEWLAALHGQPHWRIYAVTDGTQVVGGGCLYVSGELAWLGMGGVLASHRRRGGQGALMARRIADAIEAGALHIVTETGEPIADEPNPSLANMKRCGFVTVASRLNFAGPA